MVRPSDRGARRVRGHRHFLFYPGTSRYRSAPHKPTPAHRRVRVLLRSHDSSLRELRYSSRPVVLGLAAVARTPFIGFRIFPHLKIRTPNPILATCISAR